MLSCYHWDSCFIAQGPPKSQPKINRLDIKRLVSPWEVISALASFIWKPADDQQGQDLAPHLYEAAGLQSCNANFRHTCHNLTSFSSKPIGLWKKKTQQQNIPKHSKAKANPTTKTKPPQTTKMWKGKEQTLEHRLLLQHPPGRESPLGGISVPRRAAPPGCRGSREDPCRAAAVLVPTSTNLPRVWCEPSAGRSLKRAQCCCSSILQAAGGIWQASRPFNSSRQLPG